MKIATGKYTGTGSARSVITGDISPDLVIVKGAGATDAYMKMGTFGGANSIGLDGASFVTDRITAIVSGGFSVGTHADTNANGTTYYWLALEAEAADSKQSTYTGDGLDDRQVTGLGFQPDMLFVCEDGGPVHWKTDKMAAAFSNRTLWAAEIINRIKSIIADGFTVGEGLMGYNVNENGVTYHYFASKNVAGQSNTLTHAGDGANDRSITGAGFRPGVVMLESAAGGGNIELVLRFMHQAGDLSFEINEAEQADKIQALESDGFQVGTHISVNASGVDIRSWVLDARRQVQGTVTIIG